VRCLRCQQDNPSHAKFCLECGAPFGRTHEGGGPPVASYSELEMALGEALEQQTATSEVLKVISRSTFDLQPVLDTLIENATRLCAAESGAIYRFEGDVLRVAADCATSAEFREYWRQAGIRPGRGSVTGRATLERRTVHIPDVLAEPGYEQLEAQRIVGFRTGLGVPMLKGDEVLGVLSMWRTRVDPFTAKQIGLLETFADQAVIAIENVRLFQELEARNRDLTEALERQTATAEILGVIGSSPTDVRPVFETIIRSAVRLCNAVYGAVFRVEDAVLHLAALHNVPPEGLAELRRRYPAPLSASTGSAQAARERAIVQIADVEADPSITEERRRLARIVGYRSQLFVPILRGDVPLGVIGVNRREPGLFPEQHVALLKTFAGQAVIAIENLRLFHELQARNRELREGLEQQTATAEILRVISSSPTDVQPVFNIIAESAARLCDAYDAWVARLDGDVLRVVAHYGPIAIADAVPVIRGTVAGRTVIDRRTLHVTDLQAAMDEFPEGSAFAKRLGQRTVVGVPLLREGVPIGSMQVRRAEVRPFTDTQIKLLETFAHQAVIAIENVRLLQELQTRNAELTESLEQQTATAEILRVISSSPTDLQPVMEAVAENAVRVCGATHSSIFGLEGEHLRLMARHGLRPTRLTIGDTVPVGRDSLGGRAVSDRRTIHVEDILAAEAEFPVTVSILRQAGFMARTMVATPLLREGAPLGVIIIHRGSEAGPFSTKQIALLETFANQAVIAIENVRLFQALQARNRDLTEALEQQTASSQVLAVISSSPTDLQPVYQMILSNVTRLCEARIAALFLYDGEVITTAAHTNTSPEFAEFLKARRSHPGRESSTRLAALERRIVHVADLLEDPVFVPTPAHRAENVRTVLSVPMLREDTLVGVITTWRREVRPFGGWCPSSSLRRERRAVMPRTGLTGFRAGASGSTVLRRSGGTWGAQRDSKDEGVRRRTREAAAVPWRFKVLLSP
jgi:GAF domain-containing protein